MQEEKNGNKITELVFILDKSGSMAGKESDTVGGFNAMIAERQKSGGGALVTTVLFSNEWTMLHDRKPIGEIEPLTGKDNAPLGGTALLDAIGDAIEHIKKVHKYARSEDVPTHTIFSITTDGLENASTRFSSDRVKKMIKEQEAEHDWQFLFAAANIDAVETAKDIGISASRAANYKVKMDTRPMYMAMSRMISNLEADEQKDDYETVLKELKEKRKKKR